MLNPFDIEKSFILYLVGKRGSGKSTLLLKLLISLLKNKYENIILVNPTYKYDDKYKIIKFTKIYEFYTTELIEDITKEIQENKEKNEKTLLIFDDCVSAEDFKKNTGSNALNQLALNGRHFNCSMIFLSQKYTAVSSYIRNQFDYIILFNTKNLTEIKSIYNEYGVGSLNQFIELFNSEFQEIGDFIMLDNNRSSIIKNLKYYINLNK